VSCIGYKVTWYYTETEGMDMDRGHSRLGYEDWVKGSSRISKRTT